MKYSDYNVIYVSAYRDADGVKISDDVFETLFKVGHGIAVLSHPSFGGKATSFFQ